MKKTLLYLLVIFVATSCQPEDSVPVNGRVQFSMKSISRNSSSSRTQEDQFPARILIAIEDLSRDNVEEKIINLYGFGQTWTSDVIEMTVGDYRLIKFLVLDQNNKIMYATPIEGSELAQYVIDPLPIDFKVTDNQTAIWIIPQVIAVESGDTPEGFGYVGFSFDVVNPDYPSDTINGVELVFEGAALIDSAYTTNGFDSVIVRFNTYSPYFQTIEKRLKMVSPTTAVGEVLFNEPNWFNVEVYAYFESIDPIPNIHHIVELNTGASESMLIDGSTRKIKIGTQITQISATTKQEHLTWNSRSHVFDETGYWHLQVEDDLCNPSIAYQFLKDDIFHCYYYKYIYYSNDNLDNAVFRERNLEFPKVNGELLHDNVTFDNMCLESSSSDIKGILYFDIQATSTHETIGGYLFWSKETSPHGEYSESSKSILRLMTEEEVKSYNLTVPEKRSSK